jgi:cytosine deaminase
VIPNLSNCDLNHLIIDFMIQSALISLPSTSHYWLTHARLPVACLDATCQLDLPHPMTPPIDEGLVSVHIEIQDGEIIAVLPGLQSLETNWPVVDLRQGMVWPCFVDLHTHLDKSHIWPRTSNPDGTFGSAIAQSIADRTRHWQAEDLYHRMMFALKCSYAHGSIAIRTHLDCLDGQELISLPVFRQLQAHWAGKLTLQAVSLVALEAYQTPEGEQLADSMARYGGLLGGLVLPHPELDKHLDQVFELASARSMDLDFHTDENLNPQSQGLLAIARATLRHNFQGRVTCGHCCSLAVQPEAVAEETIKLVKAAGIAVVSLPMCNLYLQDRQSSRMPRHRGVTLLPELDQAGVPVALASDNCRDPFFAYGDHDMLEVFCQSVRIGHLDYPFGQWPKAITQTPATIMGLNHLGEIGVGRPADLVVFKARSFNELLSRPQSDRLVIRGGKAIDATLPDYSELDAIL